MSDCGKRSTRYSSRKMLVHEWLLCRKSVISFVKWNYCNDLTHFIRNKCGKSLELQSSWKVIKRQQNYLQSDNYLTSMKYVSFIFSFVFFSLSLSLFCCCCVPFSCNVSLPHYRCWRWQFIQMSGLTATTGAIVICSQ